MKTHLYFKNQKTLNLRMKSDFNAGMFNLCFSEYLNWKFDNTKDLTLDINKIHQLLSEINSQLQIYDFKYAKPYSNLGLYINDDPWQCYSGFGMDKYMISYLEYLEDELIRLLPIFK
ncbi:MAG: hypothetical protein ACRCX5_01190 [Bacteroidales bacterium]